MNESQLLNSEEISRIIDSAAENIAEKIADTNRFCIVGIQGGGVELAARLREAIEALTCTEIKHGIIDITFYRDDLATRGMLPVLRETHIDFNVTGMHVLLVDDVIFTGRSVKAALETVMSFGRPSSVKLFCMVDRGGRELPVQPDFCGLTTDRAEVADSIKVRLNMEDHSQDSVVLIKGE